MVRALSQPTSESPSQRPGSSQSQSSSHDAGTRPLSSGVHSQRRSSVQIQPSSQTSGSRRVSSNVLTHKRNSSLSQLDASGPPSQQQQSLPVERQRNPRSSEISVPRLNLEAGLAQFEISPATSDSGTSFELLTLPDFSSLSIIDPSVPESQEETASGSGDQSHAGLPVFLEPGSSFAFSPPQSSSEPGRDSIPVGNLTEASFHGLSPGDLGSILTEVTRDNKRLTQCLVESNRLLRKIEHKRCCDIQGFQRAKNFIFQVIFSFTRVTPPLNRAQVEKKCQTPIAVSIQE